jgi:hypothetical protein
MKKRRSRVVTFFAGLAAMLVPALTHAEAPNVATPGVATPGTASPGTAAPGVATPGAAAPGVATHDEQFDCRSNPHAFISSLIDEKSIDPKPSRVETNSVNAFRPATGSQLSAFGFPIYMVIGYDRDDTLFHHGTGKEIEAPLYGVVVSAPADSVRVRLRQVNSDATVKTVVPLLLTAIVCGG